MQYGSENFLLHNLDDHAKQDYIYLLIPVDCGSILDVNNLKIVVSSKSHILTC